jgi:hypothetical protein
MLAAKPTKKTTGNIYDPPKRPLCPDCRAVMSEADRVTEHGLVFVWYECTRSGCDGQWLEKKTAEMEVA